MVCFERACWLQAVASLLQVSQVSQVPLIIIINCKQATRTKKQTQTRTNGTEQTNKNTNKQADKQQTNTTTPFDKLNRADSNLS